MLELVVVAADEKSRLVFNPISGQMVPVADAATDELAHLFDALQDLERRSQSARELVSRELVGRMDRRGKWTAQVGGFKITAPSPTAGITVYTDPKGLREKLLVQAREGEIDRELVDEAVPVERPAPVYKVRQAGVNALRKLGFDWLDSLLDQHTQQRDAQVRRVRVSRLANL